MQYYRGNQRRRDVRAKEWLEVERDDLNTVVAPTKNICNCVSKEILNQMCFQDNICSLLLYIFKIFNLPNVEIIPVYWSQQPHELLIVFSTEFPIAFFQKVICKLHMLKWFMIIILQMSKYTC